MLNYDLTDQECQQSDIGPDFNYTENHKNDIKKSVFPIAGSHVFLFIISLFLCSSLFSQSNDALRVYKFSVDGVETRQDAKPLLYDLNGHSDVTSLSFIPDCQCFKLVSDQEHSYSYLEAMLDEFGYSLSKKVHHGDGRILIKESELPQEVETE